jgi:tetratricopeptide (TPR) repeat protein
MKPGDTGGGDPIGRLQAGALAHRRLERKRGCPDEDRLRMLVPGLAEPVEAGKLLAHAAECDWCGTVLREAAQDLAEPPTAEEEELAGMSRLADPRRRRELAELIAGAPKPARRPWFPILRWSAAGLMAAAALLGVVVYPQWARSPARTGRLLAQAYTEHRQMEMRLPGADWGPERTEMGTESSSLSEPVALLDARGNIKRAVEGNPNDPRWLQLEGRAELLGGKEDAAIAELEHARSLRPADSTILADLGAAYFQKAAKTDDPKLYSSAFEALSEGARLKPDDPVLAFNRALAAEHIFAFNVANEAWQAYLRMDSTSRFASEAREHLDKVKKNLNNSGLTPPPQPPTH